jgi:hypothetical protein
MARSGHAEAIHHFSVALDLLSKVGEKEICGKDFLSRCFFNVLRLCLSFFPIFLPLAALPPCL